MPVYGRARVYWCCAWYNKLRTRLLEGEWIVMRMRQTVTQGPDIAWTPATGVSRPFRTWPNTRSRWPVTWARTTAQTAFTKDEMVTARGGVGRGMIRRTLRGRSLSDPERLRLVIATSCKYCSQNLNVRRFAYTWRCCTSLHTEISFWIIRGIDSPSNWAWLPRTTRIEFDGDFETRRAWK